MFRSCANLTSLDVSKFNTAKVTNMRKMFMTCQKLTYIDMSNFDTAKVEDMHQLFSGCSGLVGTVGENGTAIKWGANFRTTGITVQYNITAMFTGCEKLTYIDLSLFKISVNNASSSIRLFNNCNALKLITIPTTSNVTITLPTPTSGAWYDGNTAITKFPVTTGTSKTIAVGYLVTANANGGTMVTTDGWTISEDNLSATKVVKYVLNADSIVALEQLTVMPQVSKAGYTLLSWNTNQEGTGEEFTTSTEITTDTTIYAQWTISAFNLTIHYVYEDNSTAQEDYTHSYNYNEEYSVESPVIYGYTPYLQDTETTAEIVSGTMGDSDIEITVVYKANTYNVTYKTTYDGEDTPADDEFKSPIRYNGLIASISGNSLTYGNEYSFTIANNDYYSLQEVSYTYKDENGAEITKTATFTTSNNDNTFKITILGDTVITAKMVSKLYEVVVSLDYSQLNNSILNDVVGVNISTDSGISSTTSGNTITYKVTYNKLLSLYIMPETGFDISSMKFDGVTETSQVGYYSKNITKNVSIEIALSSNTWIDNVEQSTSWTGDGSSDSPYVIENAQQLALLAKNVFSGNTYANKNFIVKQNIDLTGYNWYPVGTEYVNKSTGEKHSYHFAGSFVGDNFTISNMQVVNGNGVGLFGFNDGSITSIKLDSSCLVTGGYYVGGLVGYNNGNVSYSEFSGSVTGYARQGEDKNAVGGLVGYNNASITTSSSNANVGGYAYSMGGLVGLNSSTGTIRHAYVTFVLNYANNKVSNSLEVANVAVGGIVGRTQNANFGVDYTYFVATDTTQSRVLSATNLTSIKVGYIVGDYVSGSQTSTNVYFNAENNAEVTNNIGSNSGATKDSMKAQDALTTGIFSGWNSDSGFENVWTMDSQKNDGYPVFVQVFAYKGTITINYNVDSKTHLNILIVSTDGFRKNVRVKGSGSLTVDNLKAGIYRVTFSTGTAYKTTINTTAENSNGLTLTSVSSTNLIMGSKDAKIKLATINVSVSKKSSSGYYA